jgi:hypothetical protein
VRLRRIASEVLKVTRQARSSYLFLSAERVHPTTIRSSWKVVIGFEWERRKAVDRLVDFPAKMVLTGQPLWKNLQNS